MSTTPRRSARLAQSLVIYAKNKKRVSAFYQAVAGFAVLESAPSHDLLSGPCGDLVVHAIPRAAAAGIRIARPPVLREDSAIKPVFPVTDLDTARVLAQKAGGGIRSAEFAWPWRGSLQLSGWDPEGNVLQFTQAIKKVRAP
jgi:predicted enzyme related to lactoylglutathione lyase